MAGRQQQQKGKQQQQQKGNKQGNKDGKEGNTLQKRQFAELRMQAYQALAQQLATHECVQDRAGV
jgi:hypothetical protein